MAITIAKEQYSEFAGAAGTSGKRFMLYLNYGEGATAESPKWVKLGGSESLQFTPTVDVQTKQTKDSGMWAEGAVTGKSFEVSDTVLMKRGDTAQKAIEAFIYDDEITAEKKALQFARVDLDTKEYRVFTCIPTSWAEKSASDGMVEYDFKATGTGQPVDKTGFVIE